MAGIVTVSVILGALLWLRSPPANQMAVPSCPDLVAALPAGAAAWSLQDSRPLDAATSQTTCILAVTSQDRRFAGTVRVSMLRSRDPHALTDKVTQGRCSGELDNLVSIVGPSLQKGCTEVEPGKALAVMYATIEDRFIFVSAEMQAPSASQADLIGYTQGLRVQVVDEALLLSPDA
jgi:hypothetical protein